MTKANVLWAVLLINLLSLTGAGAYVAMRTPELRGFLEFRSGAPGPKPKASATKASATKTTSKMVASSGDSVPPPREVLPPPRATDSGAEDELMPTVEARPLGPSTAPVTEDAPPPQLYPFAARRRTFPDDKTVEVEFLIQNVSQRFWAPANVVFRSPGYPRNEVFRIDRWRLNEIALVRYRFPKSELENRLKLLRIVAVTGETIDTPIGEEGAAQRVNLLRRLTASQGGDRGLMAIMEGASAALNGPDGKPDPNASGPAMDTLQLTVVGFDGFSNDWKPPFEATTDERREAARLLTETHATARRIKDDLEVLAKALGEEGYQKAIAGEGGQAVVRVNDAKRQFEEQATKANLALSRSRDQDIRKAQADLDRWADSVVSSLESATTQVRIVDSRFSIGGV